MATVERTVITPMDKIKNSIKGFLIGLALIPGSFIVVYYASQREQASEVLEGAFPIEKIAEATKEKKAIYVTGKIEAQELGDGQFVKPGNYLEISRSGEVYAWVQKVTETSREEGNTTVKEKSYDCETKWTASPDLNIGSKKGCEGKRNPGVQTESFNGSRAPYIVTSSTKYATGSGLEYTGMPSLELSDEDLVDAYPREGNDIYFEDACKSSPSVGCQRVSISGTAYDPESDHTVVGWANGGNLVGFQGEDDSYLELGPGSYKDVMSSLSSSDSMMTLILFAISVLMFGGGLSMLVGPLLQLIEFIPFIGKFGAGTIRFIMFVFAFIVMGLTFLLIEYWYIVLILAVILTAVAIYVGISRSKKSPATA